MFENLFNKVLKKEDLTLIEMECVMNEIMEGKISDIKIAGFLSALRVKGESENEILGGARIMRGKSTRVTLDFPTLDTCGTGGDSMNTFNISSLVAVILAAGGIKVLKHGNRSVSSKCGSADIFEEFGININLKSNQVEELVKNIGIGFIFAPNYHNSMKYVMPARRELGIRTIFNMLGPLSNPGFSEYQIMGVYDKDIMKKMAHVLINLGLTRGLIVHGKDKMDEVTLTDTTYAIEIKDGEIIEFEIDPRDYGFNLCSINDIAGGSKEINRKIMLDILNGVKGPKRDIAVLNSAVAFYITGNVKTIQEGVTLASSIIESGKAYNKLNEFIKESRKYNVS